VNESALCYASATCQKIKVLKEFNRAISKKKRDFFNFYFNFLFSGNCAFSPPKSLSYMSQANIPTLKLLLIGNSNVGKSSLLLRFTDDTFLSQEEVSATIGNWLFS
jgi:ribosome biogenesis GTPase A